MIAPEYTIELDHDPDAEGNEGYDVLLYGRCIAWCATREEAIAYCQPQAPYPHGYAFGGDAWHMSEIWPMGDWRACGTVLVPRDVCQP